MYELFNVQSSFAGDVENTPTEMREFLSSRYHTNGRQVAELRQGATVRKMRRVGTMFELLDRT